MVTNHGCTPCRQINLGVNLTGICSHLCCAKLKLPLKAGLRVHFDASAVRRDEARAQELDRNVSAPRRPLLLR